MLIFKKDFACTTKKSMHIKYGIISILFSPALKESSSNPIIATNQHNYYSVVYILHCVALHLNNILLTHLANGTRKRVKL